GIAALLDLEPIAQVDLPPRMAHQLDQMYRTQLDDIPTITAPAADAPRLCVIDTGVARGHPMLQSAVGETAAFPPALGDGLDVQGHGTGVAGIALYGDVEQSRRLGEFRPRVWLDAARVTNAAGGYDDERLIASQMKEAVAYFAGRGCRLFVLAQGDPRLVYRGGRLSSWAAMLDSLAREHDALIFVAAGNHYGDLGAEPYPACLANEDARLIEPATAINVLTVGAISASGSPSLSQRFPGDVSPRPVADPGLPAPFTRRGPGLGGAIKPDLIHYGGNFTFDPRTGTYGPDAGLGVVTLHWRHADRLFTVEHGTSMSAPRAAHVAAAVAQRFPGASANLWRALVVGSATWPQGASEALRLPDGISPYHLMGYGVPDDERAAWSTGARATMIAESEVTLGQFHTYPVPIPREFRETGGERRLSVTLAFDPPVARRFQSRYAGNRLTFDLIRGMDPEAVIAAYAKPVTDEHADDLPKIPDRNRCGLEPGPQARSRATVQRGTWRINRNASLDYREPFWLVVRCLPNWQSRQESQRYAVVVTLEHVNEGVQLYAALQARVRAMVRARA
ncbi:MAG TPA: S8 family peptidase, partial [Chloroflexota bacterium]|nr:S8 family peptidase [Chloroflexota bacterium]